MCKHLGLRSIAACLGACLPVLLSPGIPAVAQLPEGRYMDIQGTSVGPLGERVQEFIDVINSGRREFAKAFVDEHFTADLQKLKPMDEHQAWFSWHHHRSQGFDHYGVRHYPDTGLETQLVIILRNHLTDAWEALSIEFERAPPYRFSGVQFLPARPPSQLPPPKKLSGDEMAKQLDQHAKKLADNDVFAGVVLLAKDGKPLLHKAYGPSDRRSKVSNRRDTTFRIGSMNMMFTGVAIAQLAERGKLSLDYKVSKYLSDDWVQPEIARRATVHDLLTHSAGLGDAFMDKMSALPEKGVRTLADYRPLVAAERLVFQPGESTSFSNAGYLLLGAIVEKVSGKSYCDYVRENIFKPAGMSNTTCRGTGEPKADVATGYARQWKDGAMHWVESLPGRMIDGGPAGNGASTAEDLLKFDVALRAHKLLNKKSTELVLSAKAETKAIHYGYGFWIRGEPGKRVVGQVGKGPGVASKLDMYLDAGYTAIVLSNYSNGSRVIADKFIELLEKVSG